MALKPAGTHANWNPERPWDIHTINHDVSVADIAPPQEMSRPSCAVCRRRKIKCDGCFPCKQCVSSHNECELQPPRLVRPKDRHTRVQNMVSGKTPCSNCMRQLKICDGSDPCWRCIQLRVVCHRPEQLGLNDEPDRGRSHSPQRGSSSVRSEASSSPVRDMINERLEMANEARANQSNSTVQESSSPFRLGSPFANEYSEGSNNSIDLTHEMLGATEHPSGHVTLPNMFAHTPNSLWMSTQPLDDVADTKSIETAAASIATECIGKYEGLTFDGHDHFKRYRTGLLLPAGHWLFCGCISVPSGKKCGHALLGRDSLVKHIITHLEEDTRLNILPDHGARDEFRRCLCGHVFGSKQTFMPHLRECLPKLIFSMFSTKFSEAATNEEPSTKVASSMHDQTQVDDRSPAGVGAKTKERPSWLPPSGPPPSSKALCPHCWKNISSEEVVYGAHVANCRSQEQWATTFWSNKEGNSTTATISRSVAPLEAWKSTTAQLADLRSEIRDNSRVLKTNKACENCRMKKIKCDGNNPCNRCTLHVKTCVWRRRVPKGKQYIVELEKRLQRMEHLLTSSGVLDPEDESVKSVHEANVPEPSSSTTIHGSVADDRETPRVVPVNPTGPTQPHTLSRQSPPSQPGGDLSSNIDIDLLDFLDQTFTDEPLKNAISYRLTNSQRARDDLSAGISNNSMQDTSSKVTEGFEPPNQLPRIQPPLGFKDPWTETNKELDEQALALSAKMTATNQISARHFTSYHPQSDAFGVGDYWLCCNVRLNTIAEVLRHVEDDIGASHAGDPHSKHKARMNKDIAQLTKDILMLRKEKKLPALHGLKICFAYFTAAMRECIIMEGAEYHEYMTPEVTHLIAIHATDPKCNAAGKLGIHIVTPKWLLESVQQGMALDESLYPPDELAKQDQQQQPADFPVGNMTNGNQSGPVVELLPGVSSTNPWIIPTKAQSNSVPKEVSDAEAKATIENFFARLKAQNVTEPTSSTPSTVSKKRTHSPDKPPPNKSARRKHACSTCGAVFQRSGTRDVHERTHSDEKLFQCTVEGCDEAFKQDNERVRHEKFQHGEKRFVCGGTLPSGVSWGCGKQFRRRDGLKEHHTKTEKGKACYKARVEIPLMTSSTPS